MASGREATVHGDLGDGEREPAGDVCPGSGCGVLSSADPVGVGVAGALGEFAGGLGPVRDVGPQQFQRKGMRALSQGGRVLETVTGDGDAVQRSPRFLAGVVQRQQPLEQLLARGVAHRSALCTRIHAAILAHAAREGEPFSADAEGSEVNSGKYFGRLFVHVRH